MIRGLFDMFLIMVFLFLLFNFFPPEAYPNDPKKEFNGHLVSFQNIHCFLNGTMIYTLSFIMTLGCFCFFSLK